MCNNHQLLQCLHVSIRPQSNARLMSSVRLTLRRTGPAIHKLQLVRSQYPPIPQSSARCYADVASPPTTPPTPFTGSLPLRQPEGYENKDYKSPDERTIKLGKSTLLHSHTPFPQPLQTANISQLCALSNRSSHPSFSHHSQPPSSPRKYRSTSSPQLTPISPRSTGAWLTSPLFGLLP